MGNPDDLGVDLFQDGDLLGLKLNRGPLSIQLAMSIEKVSQFLDNG